MTLTLLFDGDDWEKFGICFEGVICRDWDKGFEEDVDEVSLISFLEGLIEDKLRYGFSSMKLEVVL